MSIVLIPNSDKKNHEQWEKGRDIGNIPCPSRICVMGKPNSGKTTVILNLLLKAGFGVTL